MHSTINSIILAGACLWLYVITRHVMDSINEFRHRIMRLEDFKHDVKKAQELKDATTNNPS